jgi:hypothetical protein
MKGAPNGGLHKPLDSRLVRSAIGKLTEDAKGARVERVAEQGQLRPSCDLRASPAIYSHIPRRFESEPDLCEARERRRIGRS